MGWPSRPAGFISLHGIVSLAIPGRLIGPAATTQQRLTHALGLLDHLVTGWLTIWAIDPQAST